MPSDALTTWRNDRIPRLHNIEADCLHLGVLHALDPARAQEYIRSYAVLLSSEFQAACRDLHSECADRLVDSIGTPALRALLRSQCTFGRKLDTGNPTSSNLGADFNWFLFDFWDAVLAIDPAHVAVRHRLAEFNAWRNAIAHHDYDPAELGGTIHLTIAQVQAWRADCDTLATAFDAALFAHLNAVLGAPPWP